MSPPSACRNDSIARSSSSSELNEYESPVMSPRCRTTLRITPYSTFTSPRSVWLT
nr:TPA_asm: m47.5 sORF 1 [Murid betaherpesvirus 1]DBA07986.1 TPA_asm: m47.5 sORF 1 [Murid betaherpesvirus 1]